MRDRQGTHPQRHQDRKPRPDRGSDRRSGGGKPAPPRYQDRKLALDALIDVMGRGRSLDKALDRRFKQMNSMQDRAFVRMLVTQCVRRAGGLEKIAGQLLNKPLPDGARIARHAFTIGLAQIFFMDVPDHAAVDSAVLLAEPRYKNLLNALLHRALEQREDLAKLLDDPLADLPDWLATRWQATYGAETAQAMGLALRQEPPLDLSLARPVPKLKGDKLPGGTLRLTRAGDVRRLPGFDSGAFWVQDAAAAIPARLLKMQKGERVADLCAAPGGKTLQLAATGADVHAFDKSGDRLKRLAENLARTKLKANAVATDITVHKPNALFDAVLLDAPCTATGTLRRNPDVAWHRQPGDVDAMAKVQFKMLTKALAWLKPGGRLLYAVCSLEPEEGEAQIKKLLSLRTDIKIDPVTAEEAGDTAFVTEEGTLRTRPDMWGEKGGIDGFFAARLVKLR